MKHGILSYSRETSLDYVEFIYSDHQDPKIVILTSILWN